MDTRRFRSYVVRKGRKPGIYTSWEEYNQQVYGFKGSQYKGFMVRRKVESWWSLPRQDPNGDNTVPEAQELAISFGDLKVGEYVSVTGDGSSRSGTAATDLLLHEPNMVPKFDPTSFVIMEDMKQLLLRVYVQLQVGPPVFFLCDNFRSEGKKYHGFGISLQSTVKGINFLVFGRLSTDERLASQDAAFITLERLLEEAEEELVEAQCVARLSVTERVMMLEKENAELKQRLGLYNHIDENRFQEEQVVIAGSMRLQAAEWQGLEGRVIIGIRRISYENIIELARVEGDRGQLPSHHNADNGQS
ncbi:hypothetical protein Ahy_B04g072725 [Arachis hypogaea]|uniref:Ribonuclease H1 N-terminal domain-containing protein n=1 Tax=Arachis hypogaea TaxID=3818 RepID=A0A444ZNP6_ARAHY|nr:hypothetical protein Ahy_B04g072725 [Arachis hypogaea]